MTELIARLGIEWHVLLIQVANFTILLFVLHRFAYRPLITTLEDRRKRIEHESTLHAELEERIATIENLKEEVLQNARAESERLIKEGEIDAKEVGGRIIQDARIEARHLVELGAKQIAEERVRLVQEVKQDIGTLIAHAVEKTVTGAHTKETEAKLVSEATALVQTSDSRKHSRS